MLVRDIRCLNDSIYIGHCRGLYYTIIYNYSKYLHCIMPGKLKNGLQVYIIELHNYRNHV